MFKNEKRSTHFVLILSLVNFLLFHYPFFKFVFSKVDHTSSAGILLIVSLAVVMLVANAFVLFLFFSLSRIFGKTLMVVFFIINSIALYFVNTYNVIIDESMIGNVLNTRVEEAGSFFSFKFIFYLVFFGILPSIYVIKTKVAKVSLKEFFTKAGLALLIMAIGVFANANNILWIDKHSKQLGGLAMPWNYVVNLSLFYIHKNQKNEKEILLPNATIKDNKKSIVVLVIGESARSQNFSLYGYGKNTNPYLSNTENLHAFPANSCATYTTAGIKCILEHEPSKKLYEILPNYLFRNKVEVIWRSNNWGEPPLHIKNFADKKTLQANCKGENCDYDEMLLSGLKEQILASGNNKVFVVLHTTISHGPIYSKRYPPKFEAFKPVCQSVELSQCSQEELMNAYDNTIVYTDYFLHRVIDDLIELKDYSSTMLFVSDHGESLGEKNLYMHGLPMSIAPKEQYEIPFIVWVSDSSRQLKPYPSLSQGNVFHSVLNFLGVQSPIYKEELNIYQ